MSPAGATGSAGPGTPASPTSATSPTGPTSATRPPRPPALETWHAVVAAADSAGLEDLLADEVIFHSPAVHAPQPGRALTGAYLRAAMAVLGPSLTYVHEWFDSTPAGGSAVLRFTATVGGRDIEGIDLLEWGADDRLTSFTVMVRPLRGLEAVVAAMGVELTR